MLRGITHAHSTLSFDGKLALCDLQNLLTEAGYDFCLMSEHIETQDRDSMARMLDQYARLPENDCLMVPGIEIDDLHILLYGIKSAPRFESIEELAAALHADGALVTVSHPLKIRGSLPPVILPWLSAVEIWNTRYDGRQNPRARNLELFEELREAIPNLVPLVGVDFHSSTDLSGVAIEVPAAKDARAILKSIAGNCHVLLNGHRVLQWERRGALAILEAAARTWLFDGAVALNKKLKSRRIAVPASVRRSLKKLF